jgi:hypothetical protein
LKLTAIAAIISAVLAFGITSKYKDAIWGAKIDRLNAEASQKLASVTDKVLMAERESAKLNQKLELEHNESLNKIASLNASLKSVRLHDPFKRGGSCTSTETTSASTDNIVIETDNGQLSDELTEFLVGEAYRADQVSAYADSCHAYITSLINNE